MSAPVKPAELPRPRPSIGKMVGDSLDAADGFLAAARQRLDLLLWESDDLAGLTDDPIEGVEERKAVGISIHTHAVRLLRHLSLVEGELLELRSALSHVEEPVPLSNEEIRAIYERRRA